nr:DNA primase [bacterium]
MFSKQLLADIKDRTSIVGYIGERVPLKRAGRNYKGCCPFHNEKTPSFNVSDEKGIFHCFGCGEGGDVIQFVMKFDGLSFAEAVRHLAGRAGVEIPAALDPREAEKEEESSRKKRYMLRINEIARDWFMGRLVDAKAGAAARKYLQDRGISEEIWKQHFLGYADNSWDALLHHLEEKRAPRDLAEELGLLKRREGGGCYDFFRDRIIFPIVSARGEVLGFSGRALRADEGAKYINSPDSLIYHKSNCVYGMNRAQGPIRAADNAVLVEGNVDLISLHQAGVENVVAPLGTALTAGHVRLLK